MIYMGNFLFVTNQGAQNTAERRHGEFSLMVDAEDETRAIDKFKIRIQEFRSSSSLFEGNCDIFFTHLLQFDAIPHETAVMVDYKSFAGDPEMPYIKCSLPSAEHNACVIHQWQDNHPQSEGEKNKLFISFSSENISG